MPTICAEDPHSSKPSVGKVYPTPSPLSRSPFLAVSQSRQASDCGWWGGGLGLGIHSIMKLLILVSSTAVSKPVFSLSFLHLPWRRKVHRSNRVETQLVMIHIIR